MEKLIITYLIFQTIYVILNTLTSIFKIKSGKFIASLSSAICYGFYVYVLIFTMADFPDYIKAILTATTNFVGVFLSMWILEKFKKDKLWEIKATVKYVEDIDYIVHYFKKEKISYNIVSLFDNMGYIVNIYSKTQKDSAYIKKVLDGIGAKYIVHEEGAKL